MGEAWCWDCGVLLGVPGLRPPFVPPRLVSLTISSLSSLTSLIFPPIAVTFLILFFSFSSLGVGPVARSSSPSYSSSPSSSSSSSSPSSSSSR